MGCSGYNKEDCIELLVQAASLLADHGVSRFPQRSDFSDEEVVAIKAYLGPWPRALEAAGLKPAAENKRAELNRQKRIRAKRVKRAMRTMRDMRDMRDMKINLKEN